MKNFLGINWKVRFNNPTAIAQMVVSVFLPVLIYLGLDWQSLTTWASVGHALLDIISNPIAVVLIIVNLYTTMVDGTSTGLSDSAQALSYRKPNKD
ncbi:phage holin [Staphylococcus warneri]|uniref:phage holin n=1 Tax=Staphylococcus warneri TaxID=1292 RepID=UPI003CF69FCD